MFRMTMHALMGLYLAMVCSVTALGDGGSLTRKILPNGDIQVAGLEIAPPAGWKLNQDALSGNTLIFLFGSGQDAITMYVTNTTGVDMQGVFVNGSTVEKTEWQEVHGPFSWNMLATNKTSTTIGQGGVTVHVRAFLTQQNGYTYYGYARSSDATTAGQEASALLDGIHAAATHSLTNSDYTGKKYYFGFGDRLWGEMGNEVKYDVEHTHDIFTKDIGGDYIGTVQVGTDHDSITSAWQQINSHMTSNDMYVEYSSGHGSQDGLMAGVSYDEIRDNALSMPAKEVVVFVMACYSGNLIDAFNQEQSQWSNWGAQGRTLMVMASSQPDEESSTGPGTDPDEPNGPDGSAGSAFGHALWKALIGYADGYSDGVKDGFISLGEIRDFAYSQTVQDTDDGQHPDVTGVYNPALIMNKVPSATELAQLVKGSTEGMSEEQVKVLIRKLDQAMAVH